MGNVLREVETQAVLSANNLTALDTSVTVVLYILS